MNRLEKIFAENKKTLIVLACCGAPDLDSSRERIEKIIDAGANIVELGIPFSDPMAGTPDVLTAFQQAIASGASLSTILPMIKTIRERHPETGLIVSGYCNIFLQYGVEKLFCELKMIGIDGVKIFDLPYEEQAEFGIYAEKYSVPLLCSAGARTGRERAEQIFRNARGFIYCAEKLSSAKLAEFKSLTALPVAALPETAEADGVILCENIANMPISDLAIKLSTYKSK